MIMTMIEVMICGHFHRLRKIDFPGRRHDRHGEMEERLMIDSNYRKALTRRNGANKIKENYNDKLFMLHLHFIARPKPAPNRSEDREFMDSVKSYFSIEMA